MADDWRYALHCGDNLEWLRAQADDSVDLVFTSPPYEDARYYGIGFKLKGQAWVDWAAERFLECVRVSRGLVAWVVEGRTRKYQWSATPALLMADLHRAGVKLRKPPAFCRVGIPGSGGPDWWRNDYEFIVCAAKGKLPWSDNTACGHPPKWAPGGELSYRLTDGTRRNHWGGSEKTANSRRPNGSRQTTGRKSHVFTTMRGERQPKVAAAINGELPGVRLHTKNDGEAMRMQCYTPPVLANPGNLIKVVVGGNQMGSKLAHENEAPFPEKLAERFVLSYCPPDGIVLDPHAGSGTTLAVALRYGRRAVGVDTRPEQIELVQRRIQEVQRELIA